MALNHNKLIKLTREWFSISHLANSDSDFGKFLLCDMNGCGVGVFCLFL